MCSATLHKLRSSIYKYYNISVKVIVQVYYVLLFFFSSFTATIHLFYLRPYDGKWSKTMIGYGPEDDHFVVELTYNYGIKSYKLGNAFQVSYVD